MAQMSESVMTLDTCSSLDTIWAGWPDCLLHVNMHRVSVVNCWGTLIYEDLFGVSAFLDRAVCRRKRKRKRRVTRCRVSSHDGTVEDEPQKQPGQSVRLSPQVPAGGRQWCGERRDPGEPAGRSQRVSVRIQHGWERETERETVWVRLLITSNCISIERVLHFNSFHFTKFKESKAKLLFV